MKAIVAINQSERRSFYYFLLLFACLSISWPIQSQVRTPYFRANDYYGAWPKVHLDQMTLNCSEWNEVFEDVFDGNTLDLNVWKYADPLPIKDIESINSEQNVSVNNGDLIIKAKYEEITEHDPKFGNITRNASAGCIESKQEFHTGKYEARIKFGESNYIYNTFWLGGRGGEIDVVDNGLRKYFDNGNYKWGE